MKSILLVLVIMASFLFSCEENEAFENDLQVASASVVTSEIEAEDLPTNALEYIYTNFEGELVTSAFSLEIPNEGILFDVNLTNAVNLMFDEAGGLALFDDALVSCDGKMKKDRRGGKKGKKHGSKPDSLNYRDSIDVLSFTDLPEAALTYMADNYPDAEVLKVISKEDKAGLTIYKVLVAELGAIVFDADGDFVAINERGGRACATFEKLAIADLPEAVVSYISANYPDAEPKGARIGTMDEETQIHVFLVDIGVLIFDVEGTFLKLHTRGK